MDTQQYSLVFHPSPDPISSASGSGYRQLMSTAPNMAWQGQQEVAQRPSSSNHQESPHAPYPTEGMSSQHYSPSSFILRPATAAFVSDSDYTSSGSSTEGPSQIDFESAPHVDSSAASARRAVRSDIDSASDTLEWHNYNDRPQNSAWPLQRTDTEINDNRSSNNASDPLTHVPRGDVQGFPAPPEYPHFHAVSHNRSTSDSTLSTTGSNPRSASPATSISSSASYSAQAMRHPASSLSNDIHNSNQCDDVPAAPIVVCRPKHQKKRLVGPQRREICLYQQEHPTAKQEEIANHFGVERSTVSKILKYKERWLAIRTEESKGISVAKHRPSKFPSLEMRMVRYITEEMPREELLTDRKIREIAKRFAAMQHLGEDRFKASSGWIENFKQRHGIKRGQWHGSGNLHKYSRSVGGDYAPIRRTPEIDLSNPTSVIVSGPLPNVFPRPQTDAASVAPEGADYRMDDVESDDDEIVDMEPPPPVSPSRADHVNTSMVQQVPQHQPPPQPQLDPQQQSQHHHQMPEPRGQGSLWMPEPHGAHEHATEPGNAEIAIVPMPITVRGPDGQEHVTYVRPEGPQRPIRPPTPTTEQALEHLYHIRAWCMAHEEFVGFDDSEMIRKLMIDVENHLQGIPLGHRGKM